MSCDTYKLIKSDDITKHEYINNKNVRFEFTHYFKSIDGVMYNCGNIYYNDVCIASVKDKHIIDMYMIVVDWFSDYTSTQMQEYLLMYPNGKQE